MALHEATLTTQTTETVPTVQPDIPLPLVVLPEPYQQALLAQKSAFEMRLAAIESRLQALEAQSAEPPATARAVPNPQPAELTQQNDALQAEKRALARQVSNLYDQMTFTTVDRAEIATTHQPRVDELGRRFASLYAQEGRELQRLWDEFLTANDPTWHSKEASIQLKTVIRVALARLMTHYGMAVKAKALRKWTAELCQAIITLPIDQTSLDQARTLLLAQLDAIIHRDKLTPPPLANAEQAAAGIAPPENTMATQLLDAVIHTLGKGEQIDQAAGAALAKAMTPTLATVQEVVRQIYNIGGELWLADEAERFDESRHERSKSSADGDLISQTEWPGYRIGDKLIKPAIVITQPAAVVATPVTDAEEPVQA